MSLAAFLACSALGQVNPRLADPGELETAFWLCDYVAMSRGAHLTASQACSAITAELRNRRFGGNYDEMVDWWRRNKAAAHLKLRLDQVEAAHDDEARMSSRGGALFRQCAAAD